MSDFLTALSKAAGNLFTTTAYLPWWVWMLVGVLCGWLFCELVWP